MNVLDSGEGVRWGLGKSFWQKERESETLEGQPEFIFFIDWFLLTVGVLTFVFLRSTGCLLTFALHLNSTRR
ncbi:hypothetical protein BVRB_8g185270 [Beta vulgaris subsp. vulgaris]|nr:hypothetical protein BVRB_8g185270 [Beta vulgaris subsp. vulgaris]